MKTKHPRGRQTKEDLDIALGRKRMDAYLKATQASFEAAVARASTLGHAADGVLAGTRVRVKRKDE